MKYATAQITFFTDDYKGIASLNADLIDGELENIDLEFDELFEVSGNEGGIILTRIDAPKSGDFDELKEYIVKIASNDWNFRSIERDGLDLHKDWRDNMRSLMCVFFLILITSCNPSDNGGGSSATPDPAANGNDYDNFLLKPLYNFHLIVEGCQFSNGTSVAFPDMGWPEEQRVDWNIGIDGTGTTNISLYNRRELHWEVLKTGGACPMTMKLTRDQGGVPELVRTTVINNIGETGIVNY